MKNYTPHAVMQRRDRHLYERALSAEVRVHPMQAIPQLHALRRNLWLGYDRLIVLQCTQQMRRERADVD